MSASDGKIVFVCECGPLLKDVLDLDELGRLAAEMPGVAKVERYSTLCSADGKKWLAEKLAENPDLLPVIAACTPREHGEDLAEALENAGRNPFMLSRANIREQVAWVTPDKAQATTKAADMVSAAVARVGEQEPLTAPEIDCETSVLVIGAGVAGMTAAQLIADSGRDVVLVEREPVIGGKTVLLSEIYPDMECAPCLIEPLMDKVLHHPHIQVITSAEIEDVVGYLGNFTATVRKHARHVDASGCYGCIDTCSAGCPVDTPNPYDAGLSMRKAVVIPFPGALPNAAVIDEKTCRHFTSGDCDACVAACPFGVIDLSGSDEVAEFHVGAIVLSTGSAIDAKPDTAYDLPAVMTTWQMERMVNPDGPTAGEIKLPDGSAPKTIALVHCADSDACAPSDTCANTCCGTLAKHSLEIAHKLPNAEVVEFAWDRVPGGPHYRDLATSGKLPANMTLVRLVSTNKLKVGPAEKSGAQVVITMGGKTKTMEFDLVVMAPPHTGDPDAVAFAARAGVDTDESGYVLVANKRLQSATSRVDGIYVAGSAQGEKDVTAAASQASAAAGAVMSALVPGKKLVREAITASVNETLCGGCRICTYACPYKAISFDDESKVASINELLCHGCGTCAAACPSSAITARNFAENQILAEIHALFANRDPQTVL
jgi:heterodisulfide reductase subunit A2